MNYVSFIKKSLNSCKYLAISLILSNQVNLSVEIWLCSHIDLKISNSTLRAIINGKLKGWHIPSCFLHGKHKGPFEFMIL